MATITTPPRPAPPLAPTTASARPRRGHRYRGHRDLRDLLRGAFVFILLIASKPVAEANLLEFSWPSNFVLLDNLAQAFAARDYLMIIAFINSVILTVVSVATMVIFSAMVAYVWQRRASRLNPVISG